MSEKPYSAFKRRNSHAPNDLVFSQNGYIKGKKKFDEMSLLIVHFPERTYHVLIKGRDKLEYNQGSEFTDFLKANNVKWVEHEITEAIDNTKGLYRKSNGAILNIDTTWIESGYQYHISSDDEPDKSLFFRTGKSGITKFKPDSPEIAIDFVHQGTAKDPEIIKAFADVKKAKRDDKIAGCIYVIVVLIGFFLLGKLINWIF